MEAIRCLVTLHRCGRETTLESISGCVPESLPESDASDSQASLVRLCADNYSSPFRLCIVNKPAVATPTTGEAYGSALQTAPDDVF